MRSRASLAFVLPIFALVGGCADDLVPVGGPPEGEPEPTVSTVMVGDVMETRVDATWEDVWVYFDFQQGPLGGQSQVANPADSPAWDLAFQRFKIKSNGGVSGKAGVEVSRLPDIALEDVQAAPASGWVVDGPDGADANVDPDFAFNQGDSWFQYDTASHVLQARRQVYAVLTGGGDFVGVQMIKYYDDAGTGGFLRFRWKKLRPPTEPRVPAAAPAGGASTP